PCPRQRIQIIWTCVATILAASWVSVHPNIPNPKESAIKKSLRRIELMTWAIISPELMIYWAMSQWYGARLMEKEFTEYQRRENEDADTALTPFPRKTPRKLKKVRWTRTHGFFLQMGGFMLREEEKKDRVLGWKTLMTYYELGILDLSGVTEERINDHSKADWFAKGLALLQMFWFIAQCIARFFDTSLILTELELATAALALLSLVMYLLWWNKPFNAEVSIVITLLPAEKNSQSNDDPNSVPESVADSIDISLSLADAVNPHVTRAQPVEATHPNDDSVNASILSIEIYPPLPLRQSVPVDSSASCLGSAAVSHVAFSQMLPALLPSPQSTHPRVQFVSGSQTVDRLPRSPTIERDKSSNSFPLWFLFVRIQEILYGGFRNPGTNLINDPCDLAVTTVPSFYTVLADSGVADWRIPLTSLAFAALFGSVHCIGWSNKMVFASHATSLAWRIASAVITASPVVWCLMFICALAGKGSEDGSMLERIIYYLALSCGFVSVLTIPVYIVARLALLVLAFVELRHVPPGALASIQWANVLPFIH
ncbi:hypothetical protein CPC08DRAFT_717813, partial [Agrocybe pediades]